MSDENNETSGTATGIRDNNPEKRDAAMIWAHGLMLCMASDIESGLFAWKKTEKQHRVVRYNARGHAGAPATQNPSDYQWPSLAKDMLKIADQTQADKWVLGGASMGCATTLYAALDMINSGQKDKLAGIVLVLPPTAWKTRKFQAIKYKLLAVMSKLKLIPRMLPSFTKDKVVAGFLNKSMAYTGAVLERYMLTHAQEAYFPMLMGASQSDLPSQDELKKIDVPALILTWTDDSNHPVSTAKTLREILPNSEIHLANETRHVDEWDDEICGFMGKLK